MDIMNALKKTVESVRDWTNEKLENKVEKVANKGLSTNDYTTADKNKVNNIPSDLTIIDGKIYLSQDGTLLSGGTALPSGGGGGGGGGSSASVTLINELDSTTLTVAVGGEANIKFNYSSSEYTGNGTAYIYIGGILKSTATIVTGSNTLNIGEYIGAGTNEVKITCMDIYSNSKSLSYTVNAIMLKITSTFDDSLTYSQDINVRYIPYGAIEKTIHFVVDGNDTMVITSETGKQQTYIIPAMYHGTHTLKIYMTATINDVEVVSNELNYDIMCVTEGATTPMISSAYSVTSITQGELVNIPFSVYDPSNLTTEVTLTIKQADEIYSRTTRTVDRTRQTWSTRSYPIGEVTFMIAYGSISKSHTVIVKEAEINISIKETDMEFQLKAAGKSNTDNDRETWESGDVTTTFENMNWDSTGWIDDENGDTALRLSGDAKATINFMPFKSDARQTGRTIEMEFAIRDVNNRNAVAISCYNDGIGFTVTADTAKFMSEQSEISCNYTDEEKVHVAFVIEPRSEYRLMSVYLNGVLSGAKQYPENDNMQQTTTVNVSIGSPYCSVDLYCIRSYNTALTEAEARDNYIADITDVSEKLAVYADNNIYDDFGYISFSKIKDKMPVLVITGELPKAKGDKKNVQVSWTDPNNPSLNFDDTGKIDVQGTSSQWYIRKNYKIKFKNKYYQILPDEIATNVFTFKADYAESTSTHNTGTANYADVFYGDLKTPPQEKDERIRTTVYGLPCVVFHKADSASEPEFIGKYNANSDKGSIETYGFTDEYPLAESWEFLNNTSDACLFHGPVPENWVDDFEARYPDEYEDISHFKIMHDWVVSTWQDGATGESLSEIYTGADGKVYTNDTAEYRLAKFKKEFTEHFDFNFCIAYYVLTFVILMVDQRAKNMFLTTFDGIHYQPWLYDNDTCLGINNEGVLVFSPWVEDHDKVGVANVYNGADSALWVNFRESYPNEIKEFYQEVRSDSRLTYNQLMDYYIKRQADKWCISIYNEDSDYKYISMLRSDNDATNLYQIRGTGKEHLKYFIKNRLAYLDSKWYGADYADDYLSLRIYTPSGDLVVPANADITVTPFSDIYAGVMYRANGTLKQQRAKANVPITFKAPQETFNDTETAVYGASQISSIGDLSSLYCGTVNVSKAKKLTELIVGSAVEGYSNPNLKELSVGANKLLKKIDIQNCPNFTEPLALSNCPNIQEIYATGSSITGLELPSSGYLKKVYLPGTLTNLTVTNQQYIEEFQLDGYDDLTTLRIEKTVNIPVEDIMLNAPNLNRIRLLDVTWHAESEEALRQTIEKFKTCLGLDANGNNTNTAVVTGRVTVATAISDELFNDIYENFPNLIVDDGSDEIYILNYKDRDGNTLYLTRVAEGTNAIDPIEKGYIETPATIETQDYKYEFIGWSVLPTNVNKHYIITAQYSTQYAVKFYNGEELIYSQWSDAGEAAKDPITEGLIETPTKEGTDDLHYIFSGWDNLPTNVQNATSVYAQYSNVYPVRFYSDADLATLVYTQWVTEGNDAIDPVTNGDIEAPTIEGTDDMYYSFAKWNKMPTNVIEITEVYAIYIEVWAVRFYNDDIVVNTQWIANGSSAVEPISAGYIDTPTKKSTAQYNYTFKSWNGDYTNVTEARNILAVYTTTIRRYTVYFYNGDTLLQTVENVQYGTSTSYTGSTPVKTGVDNPEEYVFKGWYPAPDNIQGETTCYALFKFTGYLFGKLEDVDNPDWDVINQYWQQINNDVVSLNAGEMEYETFTNKYPLGGRMLIKAPLTSEDVIADVEIIAHNHDDLADGNGKAALTFLCKDLPNLQMGVNSGSNIGGWEASTLREFLNGEFLTALSDELKAALKPVIKLSDGGGDNKTLVSTTDSCWIPSYTEVGLTDGQNNLAGQGVQYSSTFTDGTSRLKYTPDGVSYGRWWLRSSYYSNSNDMFWRITNTNGGAYCENASYEYYIAFGFCI